MINERVIWFKDLSMKDIDRVGGKNASLGEMMQSLPAAVRVPDGFATTVAAFEEFLSQRNLKQTIHQALEQLEKTQNADKTQNIPQLTTISKQIRAAILDAPLPEALEKEVRAAYKILQSNVAAAVKKAQRLSKAGELAASAVATEFSVAVRSSATAEDLPDASFAGQQETFLNVQGIENVLQAIKQVYASLFTERAIAYRLHHGFHEAAIGLSVGIQQMVRSDCGASGVMFTMDTESGFDQVVLINASYGLGELLVQGMVNPDEFYVYKRALKLGKNPIIRKSLGSKLQKMIYANHDTSAVQIVDVPITLQNSFSLSNADLVELARQAILIEEHYGRPMDIEWAKDGIDQELYILQARPETVNSKAGASAYQIERYELKSRGKVVIEGRSVGQRIGQGIARVIRSLDDMANINKGEVLVTDMTDPNWEPIMKRAGAIITNRGGRTCHAAIIARELGIPAVVGCGNATDRIQDGQTITVSCAEGDVGLVYDGLLQFDIKRLSLETLPDLPFKIMMTIGNPERAFDFQKLPNGGVGLARLEFIINQMIGVHPRACLEWKNLLQTTRNAVLDRALGYESPVSFYVEKLSEGIATLACAFWPKPVIVRLSDFKSNEYANLLGGQEFEPKEENPMLGFRGASRYVSSSFRDSFALECQAIRKVREQHGLNNVEVMIPFVRTPVEAKQVIELLAEQGLTRGIDGLRLIMMCEIPANALMADEFLNYFDGFSIGSNDLTQLTLGLDRDSGLVAHHFDERDSAVQFLLQRAIEACKRLGKTIGICGQGPSDHPDFARWLMERGIDSLSLNPDSILSTWASLADMETKD